MTGAPPAAPPPSDTIERLPDDFWGSPTADAEPADESAIDDRADAEPGVEPERAAVGEPSQPRPSGPPAGVAVLQRLFPGRVLSVEQHAGDEGVAADAIDGGDGAAALATAGDAPDEVPAEGGLESDRSRR